MSVATDADPTSATPREAVNEAFPIGPITEPTLLSGRNGTLKRCREILELRGNTLVLYGNYGVGKSSVWRVLLHNKRFECVLVVPELTLPQLFLQILSKHGLDLVKSKLALESSAEIGGEISASLTGGGGQSYVQVR